MGKNDKLFVWLFIGAIAIAYLYNVYSKPFSTTTAYIYHPENDSLYSLRLAPDLGGNEKWEFFFTSPEYGQVINVEHEGTSAQLNRFKNDTKAYQQWLLQTTKNLQFIHAYYWPSKKDSNISAFDALPDDWKGMKNQRDFDIKTIRWVDVAIISHSLEGPLQTIVLKDAVLLEESSAYFLSQALLGYEDSTWERR